MIMEAERKNDCHVKIIGARANGYKCYNSGNKKKSKFL
jgi:hypothetical protein